MTPETIRDAAFLIGLSICAVLWCWVATQDSKRVQKNEQTDADIVKLQNEKIGRS